MIYTILDMIMTLDMIGLAGDIIGRINKTCVYEKSMTTPHHVYMILDMNHIYDSRYDIYDSRYVSRYDRIGGRYKREHKHDILILDMIYDSRYHRIGGRYNREDKQDVRL